MATTVTTDAQGNTVVTRTDEDGHVLSTITADSGSAEIITGGDVTYSNATFNFHRR